MAFNKDEYEKLQKQLNEMRKDDDFKKFQDEQKKARSKYGEVGDKLFKELQKKYSNSEIVGIVGRVRWLAIKADKKEEE